MVIGWWEIVNNPSCIFIPFPLMWCIKADKYSKCKESYKCCVCQSPAQELDIPKSGDIKKLINSLLDV